MSSRGRYQAAVWDPVSDRSARANTPRRMIIHTAWVDAGDIYGPRRGQGNSYAHFYNPTSGRVRQHQDVDLMAYAETNDGSAGNVSIEHQDERRDMPLSAAQIEADARLFAWLVREHGMPNRIATPENVTGLCWHRLGVVGNFGRFDPGDPTTWSRAQTGMVWSGTTGKTCPTNPRIRQIPVIYALAQQYIITPDRKDTPAVALSDADLDKIAAAVWRYEFDPTEYYGHKIAGQTAGVRLRSLAKRAVRVEELTAETTIRARALTKNVAELVGKDYGIDPQKVAATVEAAVQASLDDLSITLTTEDES